MTYIVGLTGGIGCGKSTIEKMFNANGVKVIDCDRITHELRKPGKAGYVYIKQRFGDSFFELDGSLNNSKLRTFVFNNKEARIKLEELFSPLIYHVVTEEIKESENEPYIILSAPLLLESKTFVSLVDRILVVDCPEQIQVERVMARNNFAKSDVEKIIQAQLPRWTRIVKADDIIANYDCEPSAHEETIAELHRLYISLAEEKI